jgi:hypothetical protein
LASGQEWCEGSSFWDASPNGSNHFYCEWAAVNFVDRIWPPRRDAGIENGAENVGDWNRLTTKELSARNCACGQPDIYGGAAPDLGDVPSC